jgi:hypothetical protein
MSDINIKALHDVYSAAKASFDKGHAREALDMLLPAIADFELAEGPHRAMIKPLVLSADLLHRLGGGEEAHGRLDRALAIARSLDTSPSLRLAETFCMVAVVEWNNKCVQGAVTNYEAGIAEGERVGAGEQWLGYHFTGLAELLVDTEYQLDTALAWATKAVEVTERAEGADSRSAFFARIALGRAQLAMGLNLEAEKTFEGLLEKRSRSHPESATGKDKLSTELRAWIAKAKASP